jgi:hypothetical protein
VEETVTYSASDSDAGGGAPGVVSVPLGSTKTVTVGAVGGCGAVGSVTVGSAAGSDDPVVGSCGSRLPWRERLAR